MQKKITILVVAVLCLYYPLQSQDSATITGTIYTPDHKVLSGATIRITGADIFTTSDKNGKFILYATTKMGTFSVSYTGYETQILKFNGTLSYAQEITLKEKQDQLREVEIVSTGYQNIPKERATGSFVQVNNELLNRSQSTDILSRLKGVTSGLSFTAGGNQQFQQSAIEIRGRATLFSNSEPLIIVDNFPYDGNPANINPNDVESISILKDAAAASAWGSRSGNGVIVITTKKGKLFAAPKVSFNAAITLSEKPNLYYLPQLSSSEYIEAEQFLFNKGAFNGAINTGYMALSPAVEIFLAGRNKTIPEAEVTTQLNTLKGYDVREQLLKYYYRPSLNQQYQTSISGGSSNQKYFVSAGYDKNLANTTGNSTERITLNASNTYYLLNNRFELFSSIVYTAGKTKSLPGITTLYPYDQLADVNGNPLVMARGLRPSFAAQAGDGKLLNWLYKPLEELNKGYSENTTKLSDYRINLSASYKVFDGLKAAALYSYEKGITDNNTLNELQSYYARDLINSYTQIDAGVINYPLPYGGILSNSLSNLESQNGRFQLDYEHSWGKHSVNAIAGTEIKDLTNFNSRSTRYGYTPETASNQSGSINYMADFPIFYNPSATQRISSNLDQLGTTNRFFSYYFNGAYTYADKYIASLSARRDESNLFGVSSNQKGVPLWSAGLAWVVNNEDFYRVKWLPQLKLRATYGYTGNVNNSISAYLTARGGNLFNIYNAYSTEIVNPPNPGLKWERIKNINIGADVGFRNGRITGSIDYWHKKGLDLIGNSPIAPQTGITLFTGNSANTSTKGLDVQLNTTNLNGAIKWFTTLLYNYSSSKVTDYKVSNGSNYNVVSANYNNPLQGYPYYSVFSFKYAGLDAQGNPQGYLNGQISKDYVAIQDATDRNELVYHGSAVPVSFGSIRNTFSYRNFDLSFNIIYKLGYYFRRSSLDNSLYSPGGGNYQMADYQNRWQKPGDELHTNVPALIYPYDAPRSSIYNWAEVLVEKGDHIRLQDLRIAYTVPQKTLKPFKNLSLFACASNLGILWRANKKGIDPDNPRSIPGARTIAFGLKTDL
jgi:TonB-linked SusC/RagA family outer membrane protein